MKKVASLIGARPQFVKEAFLGKRVRERTAWNHLLIHSGQHYDLCMSDIFFQELGIPQPAYHLGVGSGSHAVMTANVMLALEPVLLQETPDALLVYGDTNTTLAGTLVACKMNIPIIHVEAGIRMAPTNMPEEINRRLVDRVSSLLCCCSKLAVQNLAHEGITDGVFLTGDIMYDIFLHMKSAFSSMNMPKKLNIHSKKYIVATFHRNYNVDNQKNLKSILDGLEAIAKSGFEVVFPVHPRTAKRIKEFNLGSIAPHIHYLSPLGYLELMNLIQNSAFIITDSGGLQKESYYAGKRAIIIMPDTGWKELIDTGWNVLCPPDSKLLQIAVDTLNINLCPPPHIYGDGYSADIIIDTVLSYLNG